MPKVHVYNIEGKQTEEISLDETIFGVKIQPELIQFVVQAQRANAHIPFAHTKGRADVRGGGRKPWKQKGTGNARHGSIRSPLWRGGGVTFGPTKDRNMTKKVNQKERRKAIRMMLSDKVAHDALIVIDSFADLTGKTKQTAELLKKLPAKDKSVLIAVGEKNEIVTRSSKNITRLNTILADSINVADLLKFEYLILDKTGIDTIVARFK